MAKKMLGAQKGNENKKYGELILQTNEVQSRLAAAIILNSSCPDKKYSERIIGMTMGSLITLAQACILLSIRDLALLKEYKKDRDKLAHKMYTSNKLYPSDCIKVLSRGEEILALLEKVIKIKNIKS